MSTTIIETPVIEESIVEEYLDLPTIRAELIELTEKTVRWVNEELGLPEDEADAYRRVAYTVPRITKCWWCESYDCGCLVGTRRGSETANILGKSASEMAVGFRFLNEFERWAHRSGLKDIHTLRVID